VVPADRSAGLGKTSLLDFSGLEFPINKIDRKLTRDTLGTRHCDWYFADHGVLIDTAGRYTTQPDAEVDGSAWTPCSNCCASVVATVR
jgi:type VI secretion system protein ImpL